MFQALVDAIQRDKRRAVILLAVAAGVFVIVAILSAPHRHQAALAKAFQNVATANTFHAKANLELNLPVELRTKERPIVGVTARVEGDVDFSKDRPQLTGTVYAEARGRGMILFADGPLRIFPDHVAFNLTDLPALLNPKGTLIEKWTVVDTPLMKTNNPAEVKPELAAIFSHMKYVGKERLPGQVKTSAKHYQGSFTAQQEDTLAEALRQGKTGNRALHVITRLLRAFDVRSFDVWVAEDHVRRIAATFANQEDAQPRATLTLEFSDFGKRVVMEEPPRELTVQPAAFVGIFGKGELEEF